MFDVFYTVRTPFFWNRALVPAVKFQLLGALSQASCCPIDLKIYVEAFQTMLYPIKFWPRHERNFFTIFQVGRHLQPLLLIRSKISRRIWIRVFQRYVEFHMTFWLIRLFSGRKTRFFVKNGHFCDFEAPSTVTLEARRSNFRVPSNSLWVILLHKTITLGAIFGL